MRRIIALLATVAAAACSASGLSPAEQQVRCGQFADLVARAQLGSTPSEEVARDVANSLDDQLSRLGSPSVHAPAVKLHQQLHAIEASQKRNDRERADQAAARARAEIAELAQACDLPEGRFLGTTS